jgi:hypothetical protein
MMNRSGLGCGWRGVAGLAALVVALAGAGCAEVKPVDATLKVMAISRATEPTVSRTGVAVAIEPVDYTNIDKWKGAQVRLAWAEQANGPLEATPGSSGGGPRRTVRQNVAVVPLPAFIVRIVNQSDKPVDFSTADIRLEDDKGKAWRPYGGIEEVQGRVETTTIERYAALNGNNKALEALREIIAQLRVLDKKVKVAPGGEWQGFLLFKMDARNYVELDSYLSSITKLTLRMMNIGGGADPMTIVAGIARAPKDLNVLCPAGEPQTKERCKERPLPSE